MSTESKTFVSLFSGAGGLDIGITSAGFANLASVEWDFDSTETLKNNNSSAKVLFTDVAQLTSAELLRHSGLAVGELDLLAGGPPCPPFSKSRFYRTEMPRALEDPASQTLNQYLRILEDLRPRAFLLENVPGMAFKKHQAALHLILSTANTLGYSTQYRVLNAANLGVPQIRERLFVVGFRANEKFEFPTATHQKMPQTLPISGLQERLPWVTAGEVLKDLDTDLNASDDGHKAGGKHHDLLKQIPPGDNYLFFTKERGHPNPQFQWRSRYWSFLLKLSPDLPSWTIQARRSNNMGPLHWRNRILRIEEVKRLQTFPDSWCLQGKIESQWRQIGNAVPPVLGTAIGQSIRNALD